MPRPDDRGPDTPERRRHLDASDALYRSLVEQVPAIVYVTSNELRSRSLFLSPQVATILGHEVSEYLDDRGLWVRSIHADDRERVLREWEASVERQDRFGSEYRCVRPDGGIVWVRDDSVLVRDERGDPLFWQGVVSDITASKLAEESLRESEARYRLLVENVPAVVYMVAPDDDRRTLYVSPHVERTLGYSRQEWLDQPDIWTELLHPDDREPTLEAHDRHNESGEPWSREYRLIASDGRALWFRDVATLVRDERERPQHWLGVQLDITELKLVEDDLRSSRTELEARVAERTAALEEANELMALEIAERRRVERELRAAEHRYRLLAEQIPAVTYVWECEPRRRDEPRYYTSPRIEQVLGFSPGEWHDPPDFWMSRLHPDDRHAVVAATLRSETTGEPFSMEYRYLHKDGHIVWVLDQAVLLSRDVDGRPDLFQGVMLDITPRKEAEAKARDTEALYRTLVEQIPAITYVELPSSDPGLAPFTYVSPQVERILGTSADELIADPHHLGRLLHPEDRDRVLAANERAEATGEPFDQEYRLVRPDGTVVWLHSRATLLRDAQGRPMFWHGVALDVTQQRRVEAMLRELEERYRDLAGRLAGSAAEDG
jgi:PAS domain S-box-containing protein